MNIQVTLRKQTYGAHCFPNYRLKVGCDQFASGGSWVDLDTEQDLVEKLSDALLNQSCPIDVTAGGDTILYPGDTISRLHVRTLIENWHEVNFANTPWHGLKKQIDAELDSRKKKLNLEEGSLTVVVTFEFDSPIQQSGSFSISTSVARWLGTHLLALAEGKSSADGATIEVNQEIRLKEAPVRQ